MQSIQPDPDGHLGHDALDVSATIPDLARAWESAPQVSSTVRRPSTLPDPHSYHAAIEPEAIFELDEKLKNDSIRTILVVPHICERCKSLRQACSRTRPTCVRCRRAGLSCKISREGYQRLPGPKAERPSQKRDETRENSTEPSIGPQELTGRSRFKWKPSKTVDSLSQAPTFDIEVSISSGVKRPLSPGSDYVPSRKKVQAKVSSRNGKTRGHKVASQEMDVDRSQTSGAGPSAQVAPSAVSTNVRSTLQWAFVSNTHGENEEPILGQERLKPMPSSGPMPRVWTNSRQGLLTVFPKLAEAPIGFSWLQSETPVLLLDPNYAQGHWINSTSLNVDLLCDFSCYDSDLEFTIKPAIEVPTCQPIAHSLEITLGSEADMMDVQHSCLSPSTGPSPTYMAISAPQSTAPTLPLDGTPLRELDARRSSPGYPAGGGSPMHSATPNDSENPPPSCPHPVSDGSDAQPNVQPPIPLNKPPEVEVLLDSHLRFIPLLLWIPGDSGLVSCDLSAEYAYLCMGLFFISDLRHAVIRHDVSSTTGVIQGRVRWSVTLQWASGGEEALFHYNPAPLSDTTLDPAALNTARNLSRPWWVNPTDTLRQMDDTTPYCSRDLRMQFYSFIPLDLLADFYPSESFPRGWFCKSCGLINIQKFFRHQICQSTACESAREGLVLKGKVDSLLALRDPHQSSAFIQPTDNIPPLVASDCIDWDDGMQSWIYGVRDGVALYHVFTGNQEHLQDDAVALLEAIQSDVLLRKESHPSPYFIHTTRLSHPRDGSEAIVPKGTPDCIRIAYYTLCDFVHRYGERDKPRFAEVRMQAWVNSGSRKGGMYRASKSPVVVHCLGAGVVLNLTPKGGYRDAAEPTRPDKGKGRAKDNDQIGSPPTEPHAGSSRHAEHNSGDQAPFAPGPKADDRSPMATGHVDEATAAMDTVNRLGSGTSDSRNIHLGPGTEIAHHGAVEPREGRVRKKNKVTKDKSKPSVPAISMTLVHGDGVVLYGDNFECQIVRTGTTILVIGLPEET